MARSLTSVPWKDVDIHGGFWKQRQDVNRHVTLPIQHERSRSRIAALDLGKKLRRSNPPHPFNEGAAIAYDSDVAKWIEAAAYSLAGHPDRALAWKVDRIVDALARLQTEDGYLNSYYLRRDPARRWTDLHRQHELYCAGHLMEAAVAYHQATGKRKLLDVVCRYADHIYGVFGPRAGQLRGYPGHPQIELALVKLYRHTGRREYFKLAKFFIDQRGTRPHYFDKESKALGEAPERGIAGEPYSQLQAHRPVREQTTAEGHAVQLGYLYAGMADVAAETGDTDLAKACKRVWRNIIERRMYITGGVGGRPMERFTFDYDLPNEMAYVETCAAIALVFFAHRMLQASGDGQYADVMERALYNGVPAGVSLSGNQFFYSNYMALCPQYYLFHHTHPRRRDWFHCACCPANVSRLIASVGGYAFSSTPRAAFVHLYLTASAVLDVAGQNLRLNTTTDYPWKGKVTLEVEPQRAARFALALRVPGWCERAEVRVNGKPVALAGITRKGYARITRHWEPGDRVELNMAMPVERMYCHPSVRHDTGRVALQRGPIVYCLEQVDNGTDLNAIALPRTARLTARFQPDLLGGVTVVGARARRLRKRGGALYENRPPDVGPAAIRAVPYFAWANRKQEQEMLVWLREG